MSGGYFSILQVNSSLAFAGVILIQVLYIASLLVSFCMQLAPTCSVIYISWFVALNNWLRQLPRFPLRDKMRTLSLCTLHSSSEAKQKTQCTVIQAMLFFREVSALCNSSCCRKTFCEAAKSALAGNLIPFTCSRADGQLLSDTAAWKDTLIGLENRGETTGDCRKVAASEHTLCLISLTNETFQWIPYPYGKSLEYWLVWRITPSGPMLTIFPRSDLL